MKIAFIINEFPNLSGTFILNQITGLLDRGYDVDIYAIKPEDQSVTHVDVERYNLLDHTFYRGSVHQTMPASKFLRSTKAIGFIVTNLHKEPLLILNSLNVFRFGRKAASLSILFRTIPFLDKDMDEYDIVHCHFGSNGDLGALLKDIGAIKGKVITVFHGHDISKRLKTRGEDIYDYLFEVGDLFLPISNRWKNELIRLGCREQKIVVHRMGIDTNKFPFSPRYLRNDGQVQLLTVARLVEKKGVEYGIRAVAKVLKKYPQIKYKIAGDGPLKSQLKGLIDLLDLSDRVRLLGWKRQKEIIDLMQEADLLLAPSVTSKDGDQEGIPVVLMEALAQGLPVLSTQHSGIPELVQDGRSGFLVPERDVEALAEKLEYLVKYPEAWPRMGRAGRDYVEKYYDINKLNDQLVQLFQRLLDGELP